MADPQAPRVVWVVTDGRAGNENQALGLAEAVASRRAEAGRPVRVEVKRLALRPGLQWLPPRLWSALGARRGGWPFTGLVDRGAALEAPWPALAIGAGRRSAPIVAALRRVSGGAVKAVQILDPQMPFGAFDLVIAPAHDRLSGPGALSTLGSIHRIRAETLAARDPRLDRLPRPLVSVLIGGASRSAAFEEADVERLLTALEALASQGAGIAATASRRTPEALRARIAERIGAAGGFAWDGSGENPYFALLGQADALIVTADSANMASEACAAGKPVFIAPVSRLSPKLERFHAALAERGCVRALPDALDLDALLGWRPAPLDDVERAAAATLDLLG